MDLFSNLLAIRPETIQGIATELAANAIRKLIPPAQAIRLKLMSIAETLSYRPIASAANEKRLYQILEKCLLDIALPGPKDPVQAQVTNLYTFLFGRPSGRPGAPTVSPLPQPAPSAGGAVNAPATTEKDRKTLEGEVQNSPYSAKAFLKMTPRRAADLWLSLQEILKSQPATEVWQVRPTVLDQILKVLVEASRKAVSEDIFLNTLERQVLQCAFEPGEGDEWELDSHAYEEEPKVGPAISIALPPKKIPSSDPARADFSAFARQVVRVSPAKGWRLWARGRRGENPDPSRQRVTAPRMEDATASLIMLLQDILILRPNGRWLGRQLMPSLPLLKQWAVTEWRVDYWLQTTVTWPTPIWATFWEYDRFLGRWNRALAESRVTGMDQKTKLKYLVYLWIETATAVLAWDELPDPPDLTAKTKLDWNALAGRVSALLSGMGRDVLVDDRVRYWVLDVAYMLLPEVTGIGDEVIANFTSSTVLNEFWHNQVEEMRSYRVRVLRGRFANQGMPDLANDLGGRVPVGLPPRLAVQLVFSYQDDRSGSFIETPI